MYSLEEIMRDSIGKRASTETPKVVIRRSFKSKFISLLGFWPWVILLILDLLKMTGGAQDDQTAKNYVLCAAVAVLDFGLFLLIAWLRSRMRTYIYTDTFIYIPNGNPDQIKARSFVGVYQANVLPATGFFLVVWIKKIRRAFRGYRDIFITCPGSQADGTIIIRGVADYNNVLAKLNSLRVSESTNVAYTKPTESSYTEF